MTTCTHELEGNGSLNSKDPTETTLLELLVDELRDKNGEIEENIILLKQKINSLEINQRIADISEIRGKSSQSCNTAENLKMINNQFGTTYANKIKSIWNGHIKAALNQLSMSL